MSAALVSRIEARIIEAERARSRTEMLHAHRLVRGIDTVITERRQARIEHDLARLWAYRLALLRGVATATTTEQGTA